MLLDVSNRFDLALKIALSAGNLAVQMRQERDEKFIQTKSHQDFVTKADLAVEQLIRNQITKNFPNDSILGEEDGAVGSSDMLWVVDPIDGTTNYMHDLPEWAVSIAFCRKSLPEFGVIYAPEIGAIVSALKGRGAKLNNKTTSVSNCIDAKNALILLGRSERHPSKDYITNIQSIFDNGMEYRRTGSAAYSLLSVACGRAEGFYEAHLNSWDALAGLLILDEAGGKHNEINYPDFIKHGGPVIAGNLSLFNTIKSTVIS